MKEVSTSNTTTARTVLAALVLFIVLFLILAAITGSLLKYYLAMSEEMSRLKNHEIAILKNDLSDLKNTTGDQQRMAIENFKTFKKDLDNVKQHFLQEIKVVNKTLEDICTRCPVGWYISGSSCYYISGEELSWDGARDRCFQMSSILVMIKDQTELDTLNKLFTTSRSYWIGLRRDTEDINIWKWLDGTQVPFTNWIKNEPNNHGKNEHCGETMSGPWNDRNCNDKLSYICKRIRTC
ncbi:C-type lectin lectoxin-Phi2-like isoform X3 [Hyla sarda]|uniref:C-type lectin lectoxin-Phi2-like isoform X3 n=1 Tax=Hyla sarda TaxID=327740 RepID=UPI0024C3405E|nr:C-type lectin lectoxin-Phi2-like isoform X3 [Hyla sarda]